MAISIKNCGLKTPTDIQTAIETGATHIGLMHYPPSPRHLTIEEGAALRPHIQSPTHVVAVLVSPDDATLQAITQRWKPDMLQIHGLEDETRINAIRETYALPLILAGNIARADDIKSLEDRAKRAGVQAILLDAAKQGSHGGTGERFNWQWLNEYRPTIAWFLAGGLTPDNVTEAINATHPDGVDVSSGIEETRGVKSREKIAAFNKAVLLSAHGTTAHT